MEYFIMIRIKDDTKCAPECKDLCAYKKCQSVPIFDVTTIDEQEMATEDAPIMVWHSCIDHYPEVVFEHAANIGNTLLNPEEDDD